MPHTLRGTPFPAGAQEAPSSVLVRLREAAQDAGADTSGSSDTGTCSTVANSGNCYEAGQYCRNRDHGASTTDAGGAGITCAYRNGWRWTYS
ncbi:hypothetical protein ACFVYV_20095 [Streptomyces mirabilis]|uniref:hypothetical protein n=1 Tax=Streptomyces mirabilis TaxID=68239 RepID=UPI0036DB484A